MSRAGFILIGLLCTFSSLRIFGAERRVEAILIWGTNDKQSPNPKHKPLRDAVCAKLRGMPLKWTNYFEVTNVVLTNSDKGYNRTHLSEQCFIEVKERGTNRVTVKLFGRDKVTDAFSLFRRVDEAVPKGEILAIGGDGKNQTAWFVVLMALENSVDFKPPTNGTNKPVAPGAAPPKDAVKPPAAPAKPK